MTTLTVESTQEQQQTTHTDWRRLGLFGLRRLGGIVGVLWGAATITFVAVKAIPGDPVSIISGGENVVDEQQREAITQQFGLDQPVFVQYLTYLARAVTGDFGSSYVFRRPVVDVIREAAVPTLQLASSALVIALVLAFVAAFATSARRPVLRWVASGVELLVLSTPVYWIGIVLLAVFSFWLGWLPVINDGTPRSLILPAFALSLPLASLLSQVLRDGLEDALRQPFSLTVRARGATESRLRLRHALRHALLAVTTLTGTIVGGVLSGSVITETVFGRNGIGQITLQAIGSRDMPLILGLVMLSALIFIVVNLAVDTLYLSIDPKLRKGKDA